MLVPAIIKNVGERRTFDYTDLNGVKRTTNAVDVVLESGSDEFAATAFELADIINEKACPGSLCLVDLRFSTRSKSRDDGTSMFFQSVNIAHITFFHAKIY